MKDAVILMISRSQEAASEGVKLLDAIDANSPIILQRYRRVFNSAMHDGEFTSEERAMLAQYLDEESHTPAGKKTEIRFRVTESEKSHIESLAALNCMTVSEYVRGELSL